MRLAAVLTAVLLTTGPTQKPASLSTLPRAATGAGSATLGALLATAAGHEARADQSTEGSAPAAEPAGGPDRRGQPGFRPWPAFAGCTSVRSDVRSPEWLDGKLLARAGWPEAEWRNVCRVASCESDWRPEASHPGGAMGLMQLMGRSTPWSRIAAAHDWTAAMLYDPLVNLRVAYEGWRDFGGWRQWSCAWAAR